MKMRKLLLAVALVLGASVAGAEVIHMFPGGAGADTTSTAVQCEAFYCDVHIYGTSSPAGIVEMECKIEGDPATEDTTEPWYPCVNPAISNPTTGADKYMTLARASWYRARLHNWSAGLIYVKLVRYRRP